MPPFSSSASPGFYRVPTSVRKAASKRAPMLSLPPRPETKLRQPEAIDRYEPLPWLHFPPGVLFLLAMVFSCYIAAGFQAAQEEARLQRASRLEARAAKVRDDAQGPDRPRLNFLLDNAQDETAWAHDGAQPE